jgi:hypothetical protein
MPAFTNDKLARDIIKLNVSFGLGGCLACIRLSILLTHLKKYSTYFDHEDKYIIERICAMSGIKYQAWRIFVFTVSNNTYIRVY